MKSLNSKEKLSRAEVEQKILNEADFIYSNKFGYSLEKYLKVNEKTIHDHQISRLLKLKKYEVNKIFKNALKKLKNLLGNDFLEKE